MESSKKEISEKIGANIRAIRLSNGLTIERLAAEANMEYTQLSRIELGQINTSIFQVYKISKSLNVNICVIFQNL
jgi:transcriptional regulator with XRE-family HTH domain